MDGDQRLWKFRLRLLAAFGVGMVPGLFYSGAVEADDMSAECYYADEGESCLPVEMEDAIIERLELDQFCGEHTVTGEIVDEFDPTH